VKSSTSPRLAVACLSMPGYPQQGVDRLFRRVLVDLQDRLGPVSGALIRTEAEAYAFARRTDTRESDGLVLVDLTWSEPPLAVAIAAAMRDKPCMVWGLTGYRGEGGTRISTGGMIAGATLKSSLEQMGKRIHFTWGPPGGDAPLHEVAGFARAARAATRLQGARLGLLGYASMGSYTGMIDPVRMRWSLGPEVLHIDNLTLAGRMSRVDEDRAAQLVESWSREWDSEPSVKPEQISLIARMYAALEDIATENALDALTVKCHHELTEECGATACIPLSILGEKLPVSCEGDVPLLVTQLAMSLITGETTTFCDVYEIEGDRLILATCGFMPLSLNQAGRATLSSWEAGYARGVVNSARMKQGTITLARLQPREGGYRLHLARAEATGLLGQWHEMGCPVFPATEAVVSGGGEAFGRSLLGPHYAIVYADCTDELRLLAHLLDLEMVETN